jgi:hypothetical protein
MISQVLFHLPNRSIGDRSLSQSLLQREFHPGLLE